MFMRSCSSKEDILSEIRRLQNEMSALEDRVALSNKMMNGSAGSTVGGVAGSGGKCCCKQFRSSVAVSVLFFFVVPL